MNELDKNNIEEMACLENLKSNYLNGLINEELTEVFYLELKRQVGLNILTNKPIIEAILKKYGLDYKVKGDLISEEISYKFEYKRFDIIIFLSKETSKIFIHVPYSKYVELKVGNRIKKSPSTKDRMVGLYFGDVITEDDFVQKMRLTLINFNETFE